MKTWAPMKPLGPVTRTSGAIYIELSSVRELCTDVYWGFQTLAVGVDGAC